MTRKTYYIFRHGETFATKRRIPYGPFIFSASILEEGKPAIERLGYFLKDVKADSYFTSPVKRCIQTTNIISQIGGQQFKKDLRLREIFIEPFGRFERRVHKFVDFVESDPNSKTIMICTHGAVIAALVNLLLKDTLNPENIIEYPYPGELLIIENGKLKKYSFNQPVAEEL